MLPEPWGKFEWTRSIMPRAFESPNRLQSKWYLRSKSCDSSAIRPLAYNIAHIREPKGLKLSGLCWWYIKNWQNLVRQPPPPNYPPPSLQVPKIGGLGAKFGGCFTVGISKGYLVLPVYHSFRIFLQLCDILEWIRLQRWGKRHQNILTLCIHIRWASKNGFPIGVLKSFFQKMFKKLPKIGILPWKTRKIPIFVTFYSPLNPAPTWPSTFMAIFSTAGFRQWYVIGGVSVQPPAISTLAGSWIETVLIGFEICCANFSGKLWCWN